MKNNKILDLFCGAGGLSLGFERKGYEIIEAIDSSIHAITTYNNNRKNKVAKLMDIKNIDQNYILKFGKIDGIIGGPPCLGFSTAGQRIIDDERNELYRDYFKILEWAKPSFFLMENVTGILNFSKGLVKKDIFRRVKELGYTIYIDTLNAAEFGIPQNRKRVFFIGIRNDLHKEKFEFPKKIDSPLISIEDAISDLPSLDKKEDNTKYLMQPKTEYQKYIRNGNKILHNHLQSAHKEETKNVLKLVPEGGSIKDIPVDLRGNRNYNALLRKMDRRKPSYTIDTGHRTYFHYEELRVPSVRENARLQSFQDDYIFFGPKQEQYKQVGNAVPPILAEIMAEKIKNYFYE